MFSSNWTQTGPEPSRAWPVPGPGQVSWTGSGLCVAGPPPAGSSTEVEDSDQQRCSPPAPPGLVSPRGVDPGLWGHKYESFTSLLINKGFGWRLRVGLACFRLFCMCETAPTEKPPAAAPSALFRHVKVELVGLSRPRTSWKGSRVKRRFCAPTFLLFFSELETVPAKELRPRRSPRCQEGGLGPADVTRATRTRTRHL